jgi:TatD DNase family protein
MICLGDNMFVDSHAHLTGPSVIDHVEEMLERARQNRVKAIVNICTDQASLERGLALVKRHRWVFNAAAATPHDVQKIGDSFFPLVARYAREGGLLAIGETGLDYHYEHSPKEEQIEHLERYLELAMETKLPMVFHCRDAFQDLFNITKGKEISAVLHCFTGTLEEAQECLERGWMVSLSGIVTFKNSAPLREVARRLPLEQLLIETDTPYLAPLSKRGKMNEPGNVVEIAEVIAQVRGISAEEVGFATARNATQFFSFPKHIIDV